MHPSALARGVVALATLALSAALAPAQAVPAGTASATTTIHNGDPVPGHWIVLFQSRSFDLDGLRQAIAQRRPAAEIDTIVAGLQAAVERDQLQFVLAVQALGGRVTSQWWIVDGAAVEIDGGKVAALRALPNVARVEPDRWWLPSLKEATNAQHHDSDRANQRTVGGVPVRGSGIGVAVLDTGVDADMGGTGRPHAAYYPGGNPANTTGAGIAGSNLLAAFGTSGFGGEDTVGHGTHVSGCVAAHAHADVDDGIAPDAGVVGIRISDNSGNATTQWLVSAWQKVASERVQYNLAVANNSFSGSPSLLDPIQQALDTTAWVADVAVVVSAGNFGTNTTFSQRAYNGVAVGSVDKYTLTVSSFSARGPLSGSTATYPDVAAVGNAIYATRMDDESHGISYFGTSQAAPLVAGILALVRQTAPSLNASEAQAVVLNTTLPSSNRNAYGLGFAHADRAVVAAMAGNVVADTVAAGTPLFRRLWTPPAGPARATAFWMRAGGQATAPNLDLTVYDAQGVVVATDGNVENNYEQVAFTASGGTYRVEVARISGGSQGSVDFALATTAPLSPPPVPTLTALNPTAVTTFHPQKITITGTDLDFVNQLTLAGKAAPGWTVVSPTRIDLQIPGPWTIGSQPVVVSSASGSSNALPLQVLPQDPPQLTGPTFALRGLITSPYELYDDAGHVGVVLVSPSNQPSTLNGVVSLGLGNAFSTLVPLLNLTCDPRGYARFTLRVPANVLPGSLYLQAITVDPTAPLSSLPLTVSGVVGTQFF